MPSLQLMLVTVFGRRRIEDASLSVLPNSFFLTFFTILFIKCPSLWCCSCLCTWHRNYLTFLSFFSYFNFRSLVFPLIVISRIDIFWTPINPLSARVTRSLNSRFRYRHILWDTRFSPICVESCCWSRSCKSCKYSILALMSLFLFCLSNISLHFNFIK